jgi:hypothetical protein
VQKKAHKKGYLKKGIMGRRAMEIIAQYVEAIQQSIDDGSEYVRDQINRILQKFELSTRIEYPADVEIRHQLKVPIKEHLTLPVSASVRLDTVVHSKVEVPLELDLKETDLMIDTMSIAVDQKVMIQDEIELDVKELLDSLVDLDKVWVERLQKSLPLKKNAKLKVNQPVRIIGTLNPKIQHFNLKVKTDLHLDLAVPINQEVKVQGMASVNINNEISAPIQTVIPVSLEQPIKVKILGLHLGGSGDKDANKISPQDEKK